MSDLINKEELISEMKDTKEIVTHMFQFTKNQINVAEAVADAMLCGVINAPAVDTVPVVHGHWNLGRCSKCDGRAPYWSMATTYYESNYCPHCGAKMDEDGDHNS